MSQGFTREEALSTPISIGNGGTGATTLTGVLTGNGTSPITGSAVTQYTVLLGDASNAVTNVSGTGTSAQVLTSNGAGSAPTWQDASGGGVGNTGFCAYMSSNQTFSKDSDTDLQVNTEVFDDGSDFNTTTYTYTAPSTARYCFSVTINFASKTGGTNKVRARLVTSNGTYEVGYVSDTSFPWTFGSTKYIDMDANDTAILQVWCTGTSTSDATIGSGASPYLTTFCGFNVT